jgi:CRISPR-associated protein Cas2
MHHPADWREALADWKAEEARHQAEADAARPQLVGRVPVGWWIEAFADRPSPSEARGHRCGEKQMLAVVAYDVREPRRLAAVARHCEDFGVRVQYSVFECRLEADTFERFWEGLLHILDLSEDRAVAYKICASCAENILAAGDMVSNEKVVAYVV